MRRTRRDLIQQALAATAVVAFASCVPEQTARRIPRIGYISGPISAETSTGLLEAFHQGLRDHGYIDGETVRIEGRYCTCELGREGEWDEFATELVRMPVDVIVSGTNPGWNAATRATKTIPIVMLTSQDPVAAGLADSLARPGRNVTGIAALADVTSAKRLELVRELMPSVKRVGVIWDGNPEGAGGQGLRGIREIARGLDVDVVSLVVGGDPSALLGTLRLATDRGVDALIVGGVPFYIVELRREIASHALERRIPLVAAQADWVDAGALLSFGHDRLDTQRRMAYFVDRILKGSKPGDLPIEQPSTFETILNLKTAKELGLTIPPSVLARATKVIQ